MKESYEEDLANHFGLDPYADAGDSMGVASVKGTGRPAIELRNQHFRVPIQSCQGEGHTVDAAYGEALADTAESENLCMCGYSKRENREVLLVFVGNG